jgi:hypothetical protein
MVTLKRKLNYIFGLVSVGILLMGIVLGITTKENSQEINSNQTSAQNLQSNTENDHKQTICSGLLEEDENSIAAREYSDMEVVDCTFVGCGGIF